jgi:hypothetical protein
VIAKKVMMVIMNLERFPRIIHVGTERKSVYELARISKPDVLRITREDVEVRLAYDISLNTSLFNKICAEIQENLHDKVK